MLAALGMLGAAQTEGTQATVKACTQLLNYAVTHPDATLHFHASKMILNIHSDASYLSESKARSHAGGYFYLTDDTKTPHQWSYPHPQQHHVVNLGLSHRSQSRSLFLQCTRWCYVTNYPN